MCLGFITGVICLVRTVLNDDALPLDWTYDGIINWFRRLLGVTMALSLPVSLQLERLYNWMRRKMKGERKDENIRWSLSTHQKRCDGNVEEARASGSEEARGPMEAQDVVIEGGRLPHRHGQTQGYYGK